ncbi:MAG TPA: hypothetical protein VF659_03070 [Pyrinomonadaceae bacterium]|jgi:hypothetical protein
MRRRISFACGLAMLLSTSLPAPAGSKGLTPGAAPRLLNALAAAPAAPAPLLTIDPELTALARRITASPSFSGVVTPGRLLNVKLVLPPELRTGVVSGSGRRPAPPRAAGGPLPGLKFTNVALQVKWGVFETVNGGRAALAENRDFQSPPGAGAPAGSVLSRNFVLAPLSVVEYTGKAAPVSPCGIVATVTVTADRLVPNPLPALPPVLTRVTSAEAPVEAPLSLSALEVPKVFVLFLDKQFGGAAAIYLPKGESFGGSNSNEAQAQIFSAAGALLNTYNTAVVNRLGFVTWFGSYVAGLEALRKVRGLPHVDLKERKNSESDLNTDDFITRGVTIKLNDIEVEDESSAVLLLGPPGTRVRLFQDRDFGGGEFDLLTSDPRDHRRRPPADYAPGVLVGNFDAVTRSVPAGAVTVVKKFTIQVPGFPPTFREVTPNDRLSSFRWGM